VIGFTNSSSNFPLANAAQPFVVTTDFADAVYMWRRGGDGWPARSRRLLEAA